MRTTYRRTVSILTNDTLNGKPATPSIVTVTIDNDGILPILTVDSTGVGSKIQ